MLFKDSEERLQARDTNDTMLLAVLIASTTLSAFEAQTCHLKCVLSLLSDPHAHRELSHAQPRRGRIVPPASFCLTRQRPRSVQTTPL